MTDHYGYTMASLSETGAIFASCSRKNKTTNSTLFFRSFDNWASNSEWTLQLVISFSYLNFIIYFNFFKIISTNN